MLRTDNPGWFSPREGAMVLMLGLLSTAACVLPGCATTTPATEPTLSSVFGDATRTNMSAQFVPPTDAQKANTYIPPNAARQQLALETYEAGEVELTPVATE